MYIYRDTLYYRTRYVLVHHAARRLVTRDAHRTPARGRVEVRTRTVERTTVLRPGVARVQSSDSPQIYKVAVYALYPRATYALKYSRVRLYHPATPTVKYHASWSWRHRQTDSTIGIADAIGIDE